MNQQYDENSQFYFDKIPSGSSYKTLKLWEIHNCIFMNVSKLYKIHENFVPTIKLGIYGNTNMAFTY